MVAWSFFFVFRLSLKMQTNQYRYDRPSRRTLRNVWALTSRKRWWTCTTHVLVIRYAFENFIRPTSVITACEVEVLRISINNHRQGLSEDEMVAFHGNLCVPGEENPEAFRDGKFFGFDLAVVGLGFHHFDAPDLAAKRLAARLRPGGVLMIIDFLPHASHGSGPPDGGHDHHHHHHGDGHGSSSHGNQGAADMEIAADEKAIRTVTHHGFSEERIREIFIGAGVGKDFLLEDLGQVKFGEKHGKRTLFMARGTKE